MRADNLYRRLLVLLPRAFRREAADDLVAVFRAGLARARRNGRLALATFWCRIIADLLVTGTAERCPRLERLAFRSPSMQMKYWFGDVASDIRQSVRRLAHQPGATAVASATLALGLAAAIVGGVLMRDIVLRPLPFPEADRLVRILEVSENGRLWWPSYPNARDWREHARVFDAVGIGGTLRIEPVVLEGTAVRAPVARAGTGFFGLFGLTPAAGRLFGAHEHQPGATPVAVVTERFWRGALGGRSLDALAVTIAGTRYQVVGVLPGSFRFLGEAARWTRPADVWIPLERETVLGSRTSHGEYHVVARLRRGMSLEQARREMNALATRLREQHGEPTQAASVLLTPLHDVAVRTAREPIRLLLYAGLGVLLVSCLNLASAVLAEGLTRRRELHIRTALGATRLRVAVHVVTSAATLALPGTVLGLLLAAVSIRVLQTQAAGAWPRVDEIAMDWQIAAAGFGIAAFTATVAGLLPAVVLSARAGQDRLRSRGVTAGGREPRLWTLFVTLQVAMTLLLLAGTGLLVRSFIRAADVDLGYQPRNVLAVDIALPSADYESPASRLAYYDRAVEALAVLPEFESVGLTSVLPTETTAYTGGTRRDSPDATPVMAGVRFVDRGFFDTLGIPLLQGDRDAFGKGGGLIDRRLQELQWGDKSPLGDRVISSFAPDAIRVDGVVGSVREWYQGQERVGAVYADYRRHPRGMLAMHIVARHRGDAAGAAAAARQALRVVDPLVPIEIAPLESHVAAALDSRRLLLVLATGYGLTALLLAAGSVYAMIAFAVGRQRREAAIRLALGASPASLRRRVFSKGLTPSAMGCVLGLLIAIPMGRLIRAHLFGVDPMDPPALLAAVAAVLAAAVAASVAPARRAARVDPVSALRQE